jgi:hypothetical protein
VSEPLRFNEVPAGQPPAGTSPSSPESGRTRVIVKVRKPGYVPDGFTLRTRVDDLLFTAEAREADVTAAAADPDVESVERGRALRLP